MLLSFLLSYIPFLAPGGRAALAGAIVVGARKGKYKDNGKMNPMPGHNIPMGA